ncbi:MAG: hypothetical protein AB7S38_28060 [Vulcanimicrobiota bacterium]
MSDIQEMPRRAWRAPRLTRLEIANTLSTTLAGNPPDGGGGMGSYQS